MNNSDDCLQSPQEATQESGEVHCTTPTFPETQGNGFDHTSDTVAQVRLSDSVLATQAFNSSVLGQRGSLGEPDDEATTEYVKKRVKKQRERNFA
jgi:hypothetical protein